LAGPGRRRVPDRRCAPSVRESRLKGRAPRDRVRRRSAAGVRVHPVSGRDLRRSGGMENRAGRVQAEGRPNEVSGRFNINFYT